MRILVFGAGGQLGVALLRAPTVANLRVIGVTRAEADLTDAAAVAAVLTECQPDAVINAGAYTAVDRAEAEPERAYAVNATGPEILGRTAARLNIPVVHVSTDYVFDGTAARPYREDDPTAPLGVYGASKRAGEVALSTQQPAHVIVRTAWVFGQHGHNFVKTMQRLGQERPEVRVVADQRGTPTAAVDLAAVLLEVAQRLARAPVPERLAMAGIYHFTNAGETTWHGLAEAVFADQARRGGRRPICTPITTGEYPTSARRPANSRLDNGKIERMFGIARRPWQQALADVLDALARSA
jgi:dTDP-4-dehydrorhamnose reductase